MADFGELVRVVGRKEHRCSWCLGPIPQGEEHHHFKGMWQGDWQDWRMHDECHEDLLAANLFPDEGWTEGTGEMPERIAAIVEARKLDAAVPRVKQ